MHRASCLACVLCCAALRCAVLCFAVLWPAGHTHPAAPAQVRFYHLLFCAACLQGYAYNIEVCEGHMALTLPDSGKAAGARDCIAPAAPLWWARDGKGMWD